MVAIIDPILRGSNLIFLVITLALTGNLIATQDWVNPQVNFAIFASTFGIVFGGFYGIAAAFIEILAFPVVIAVLDFLNVVFLFAGATAVAAALGCHSCLNTDYLDNNTITQGSTKRCREAQATIAFLYFAFFSFLGILVYSVILVFKNGAFSLPTSRRSAAPRTGLPTMSQV